MYKIAEFPNALGFRTVRKFSERWGPIDQRSIAPRFTAAKDWTRGSDDLELLPSEVSNSQTHPPTTGGYNWVLTAEIHMWGVYGVYEVHYISDWQVD